MSVLDPLRAPERPAAPPNPYAPPGENPYALPRRPGRGAAGWRSRLRLPSGLARRWARPLALGAAGLALTGLAAGLAGGFRYQDLASVPLPAVRPGPRRSGGPARRDSPARLARLIEAQRPQGVYIEVDTMANRLYLMRGDRVLREAVCSTGTGGLLEDPASGRRWIFDTPRGTHRVVDKVKNPVWNKPDWAFIEEGQPIPRDAAERIDTYSLGDYALYLGDGYLIHGTLYQRLLGRSVTHGCVRLGDEDLEAVWKAAGIGTRVYIF
jgi:L,D-transpeptidase-like protein